MFSGSPAHAFSLALLPFGLSVYLFLSLYHTFKKCNVFLLCFNIFKVSYTLPFHYLSYSYSFIPFIDRYSSGRNVAWFQNYVNIKNTKVRNLDSFKLSHNWNFNTVYRQIENWPKGLLYFQTIKLLNILCIIKGTKISCIF